MSYNTDLFGNAAPVLATPLAQQKRARKREAGLRLRLLGYFKDRRYQAFTISEVLGICPAARHDAIRKAFAQLQKSGHLVSTGDRRGEGAEGLCLTANLHRYK